MAIIRQAVILCGGLGSRMGELTRTTPKPMLPVAGKPLLEHILAFLRSHGIEDVILAAHYRSDVIERHFRGLGPKLRVESEPLGTAGGLPALRDELDDDFLVYYGDEIADFRLADMLEAHAQHQPLATVLARPSHHPWDGHLIQTDESGSVTEFAVKLAADRRYRNLGDLGIYAVSRRVLDYVPPRKAGFFEDVFPAALASGERIHAHFLESAGYVRDVGRPERISEAETYLDDRTAVVRARTARGPVTTAFLDRDGVLVEDSGLIRSPDQLRLLPGAADAVRLLNERGVRAVVVTNQPVVARGLCGEDELRRIHADLARQLAAHGARLDAIYYCPHHPETHHNEGLAHLRRGCDCRKPRAGMLMQARRDLGIDLGGAVMIGDSTSDVEAGCNAGIRTVLLETGRGRVRDGGPAPDSTHVSLLDAVHAIIAGSI